MWFIFKLGKLRNFLGKINAIAGSGELEVGSWEWEVGSGKLGVGSWEWGVGRFWLDRNESS
jgi:hypothetical protein